MRALNFKITRPMEVAFLRTKFVSQAYVTSKAHILSQEDPNLQPQTIALKNDHIIFY